MSEQDVTSGSLSGNQRCHIPGMSNTALPMEHPSRIVNSAPIKKRGLKFNEKIHFIREEEKGKRDSYHDKKELGERPLEGRWNHGLWYSAAFIGRVETLPHTWNLP